MKALVLGASGQLGFAAVRHLLAQGWTVVAATWGRGFVFDGLRRAALTIVDGGTSRRDLLAQHGSFDAVFDPKIYTDEDAQDLIAARQRFETAVVISTCSVYADAQGRSLEEAAERGFSEFGGPIGEDTPTIEPGSESYTRRKVAIEKTLLASGIPVTILRPCAIYGIHATHPREWWLIKRTLDGRRHIPVAFDGESVFHTSNADGVASLAELCMGSPDTRVLNVADPEAHSIIELARLIEAATGLAIPLAPFSGPPAGSVGDTPWSSPHRFALDCGKAHALGWDGGKPYAEAIKPYCNWILETAKAGDWRNVFTAFAGYPDDPFDYDAEDAFLNAPRNPPGYEP